MKDFGRLCKILFTLGKNQRYKYPIKKYEKGMPLNYYKFQHHFEIHFNGQFNSSRVQNVLSNIVLGLLCNFVKKKKQINILMAQNQERKKRKLYYRGKTNCIIIH